MTQPAAQGVLAPREIQLLTFAVMGVKIGVDAEQIAEMMSLDAAEARGLALLHLRERIPFYETASEYHAPKVILIKDERKPYAVVIDRPDDITTVSVDSIQPLPPLIVGSGSACFFWGAVERGGEIILLMDFSKLAGVAEVRDRLLRVNNGDEARSDH